MLGFASISELPISALAEVASPPVSSPVAIFVQANQMNIIDIVKKGSTDRSVTIRIIDDTTGLPETAVEHDTAGIALWYRREGEAQTPITEVALAALTTAHTDGGIEHIGDGSYRLDLPDAAFATGANHVDVGGTVTGMIVIGGRVRLVDYDPEDTVRLGLTALPNAAADAAGGLPISDAGGLDLDTMGTNVSKLLKYAFGAVELPIVVNSQTSLAVAGGFKNSVSSCLFLITDVSDSNRVYLAEGSWNGTTEIATLDAALSITIVDGDLLTMVALADAETIGTGTGLTAIPWNAAWDAEVQSEVADALAVYDPPTKAELDSAVAPLATSAALTTVGSNVSEILTDTGTTLPATLATLATASALATVDTNVDAILVDTGTDIPATLATLATAAALTTVDTEVGQIKAKTDSLTFTTAGNVDANIQYINDAQVTGNGNSTPWDGA